MARKKKTINSETSLISKQIYLVVTLAFFIIANMYLTDLIIEEIQLGNLNINNAVFALNYVENTGAAFSIFAQYPYVIIGISVIAMVYILFYLLNNIKDISMRGVMVFSLLLAGIFGNLYERIFFGFVRDFIQLTFVNFPIFNISDVYINVSIAILVVLLFSKNILKDI